MQLKEIEEIAAMQFFEVENGNHTIIQTLDIPEFFENELDSIIFEETHPGVQINDTLFLSDIQRLGEVYRKAQKAIHDNWKNPLFN